MLGEQAHGPHRDSASATVSQSSGDSALLFYLGNEGATASSGLSSHQILLSFQPSSSHSLPQTHMFKVIPEFEVSHNFFPLDLDGSGHGENHYSLRPLPQMAASETRVLLHPIRSHTSHDQPWG